MIKSITTTLAAAAIVVSPVAVKPAAANHDISRALLGIAAVALIANEIDKNKKKKAATVQTYQPPAKKKKHVAHKPKPKPKAKQCLRQRWTENGWVTYKSQKCLERLGLVDTKPKECLRKRWTPTGWEKYYAQRCLARYGYN